MMGPRVLICTAAGREGINLQFARVLFNHDLPWNPMDMEQRIGRIHRYGQRDTAQVYNIVSADTIERSDLSVAGQKLLAIAQTLGKVDEYGQVTEDLRARCSGNWPSEFRMTSSIKMPCVTRRCGEPNRNWKSHWRTPNWRGTWSLELFQDLEGFNLDDYRRFDDGGAGMNRLLAFTG